VFSLEIFLFEHNVATCSALYGLDVAGGTKLIN
jgi:hypothetical protein